MAETNVLQNIYRYLSSKDIILVILGFISSIAFGSIIPIIQLLDGKMIDTYRSLNGDQEMFDLFLISIYIAVASFIVGWSLFTVWLKIGNKLYFKALLNQ